MQELSLNLRSFERMNPVWLLLLGVCPVLGATQSVLSALGMGLVILVLLTLSSLTLSLLRKLIPEAARPWACLLVTAGFVSLTQMLLHAFLPQLYRMLGVYLAVLAVDLLLFGAAESACSRPVGKALWDGVRAGLTVLAAVLITGVLREVFGSGTFAGTAIPVLETHTVPLLLKAPGGFLVFALTAALTAACFGRRKAAPEAEKEGGDR